MAQAKAAPVKAGMQDRTSSNVARDGAAKSPQKSFPTTHGMRSRIGEVTGVKGAGPSGAPDASSPNPLDPEAISKGFSKSPAAWGMRDANKQSVNHSLGDKVLSEAQLSVRG